MQETITVADQTPVGDTVKAGTGTNFNDETLQNMDGGPRRAPTSRRRATLTSSPGIAA